METQRKNRKERRACLPRPSLGPERPKMTRHLGEVQIPLHFILRAQNTQYTRYTVCTTRERAVSYPRLCLAAGAKSTRKERRLRKRKQRHKRTRKRRHENGNMATRIGLFSLFGLREHTEYYSVHPTTCKSVHPATCKSPRTAPGKYDDSVIE